MSCANKIQTLTEQHLSVTAIRPDGPAYSLLDYRSVEVLSPALQLAGARYQHPHLSFRKLKAWFFPGKMKVLGESNTSPAHV